MKRRPIIVTRAGEAGAALADSLQKAGEDVLWLPAFSISAPPDERHVTAVLGRLADYQLAVFVSPAAVEATADRITAWPRGVALAAVGDGTRRALLARIRGADRATLHAPATGDTDGEGGGSEALWRVLQPSIGPLQRALILRAENGREWLSEQLMAAGVVVESVAVYSRRVADVPPAAVARLRDWHARNRFGVLVVTSSEGVDAVVGQVEPVTGPEWIRAALALASHERIAARLRTAGFPDVKVVPLDADSIRKATLAQ